MNLGQEFTISSQGSLILSIAKSQWKSCELTNSGMAHLSTRLEG